MKSKEEIAKKYQPLFDLMGNEYGEILTESEMDEIITACDLVKNNFQQQEQPNSFIEYLNSKGLSGNQMVGSKTLLQLMQGFEAMQNKSDAVELREALNSLLNPDLEKYSQKDGCPLCDYGVLRNPEKQHWDNCNWNNARKVYEKSNPQQYNG